MCSAKDARELAVLMRISRDFDIVGDVTVTVDNPSELIAWAVTLKQPQVLAWRAEASGCRFVQVSARGNQAPIRGRVTAVLPCKSGGLDRFWAALGLDDLAPGDQRDLNSSALSRAWTELPLDIGGRGEDERSVAPVGG